MRQAVSIVIARKKNLLQKGLCLDQVHGRLLPSIPVIFIMIVMTLLLPAVLLGAQGDIVTFAGGGPCDGGAADLAALTSTGVAVDSSGNIYIADTYNNRIRKVDTAGVISTIAGNGAAGYSGDGGSATSAMLNGPMSVAIDAFDNIYIADQLNNCIRKVNTVGVISTVAGNGTAGFFGDGGLATSAALNNPTGVAIDSAGNIYIADANMNNYPLNYGNNRIRKVDTSGIISTVAGNGAAGYLGDGGAATSATLGAPQGVAVDAIGNIYIADVLNNRIRKVDSSGVITTVAGNGTSG